jgi:hypothetical protein
MIPRIIHQEVAPAFDLHDGSLSLEPADLAWALFSAVILGVIFAFFRRRAHR